MGITNTFLLAAAVVASAALVQNAKAADTAYHDQILSQNPVVYYEMDESAGTTATDSSGNGHDGTYGFVYDATSVGTPAVTLGASSATPALNTSIAVSGAHSDKFDPVKLTDVAALNAIGTGPFSVQFWFQTSDVTNRQDLFDFRGGNDISMQVNNGVAGGFTIFPTSGPAVITSDAGVVSANTWYMVTVTRDASNNLNLYLNGSLLTSGTDAQDISTGASGALAIGNKVSGSAHLTLGNLDEFAFYNTALSASDVATDYSIGSGTPIPEPASLSLLALGGIALLTRRRKA
jgi:hypothetical protein